MLALSVWPVAAVPLIVGGELFEGGISGGASAGVYVAYSEACSLSVLTEPKGLLGPAV